MGEMDTTSINYLKSVVFQGNEDAYYLTENVFAFASSAFIPISQAAKVGNLTFRSGATTVAKEGIAMMAGAGASDITMKISGSQTVSVDEINVIFKDRMGYELPYKPGTKVTEIEIIKTNLCSCAQ